MSGAVELHSPASSDFDWSAMPRRRQHLPLDPLVGEEGASSLSSMGLHVVTTQPVSSVDDDGLEDDFLVSTHSSLRQSRLAGDCFKWIAAVILLLICTNATTAYITRTICATSSDEGRLQLVETTTLNPAVPCVPAPALPPPVCTASTTSTAVDPRLSFLTYTSNKAQSRFNCALFPPNEHPLFTEVFYQNITADPQRPQYFQQQIIQGAGAFTSCPASRPRTRILHAKFGALFGIDSRTAEPRPFGAFTHPDAMSRAHDFTRQLRARCDGMRFCCINLVGAIANTDSSRDNMLMITWLCDEHLVPLAGDGGGEENTSVGTETRRKVIALNGEDDWQQQLSVVRDLADLLSTPIPGGDSLPLPSFDTPPHCTLSLHLSMHGLAGDQGAGLIHQMSVMTANIGVAALSTCDLNVEGFYPDFDLVFSVPLGLVIDLPALNQQLASRHMAVRVLDTLQEKQLYPWTGWAHSNGGSDRMIGLLGEAPTHLSGADNGIQRFRDGSDRNFYILGHPFAGWIFSEQGHLRQLRDQVLLDIPFAPSFVQASRAIQQALSLSSGQYSVAHFRLEADTAIFAARRGLEQEAYREKAYTAIESELRAHISDPETHPIYLSTAMTYNDPYVQRLVKVFPKVVTKDLLLEPCGGTSKGALNALRARGAHYRGTPQQLESEKSRWHSHPVLAALSHLPWTSLTDECGLHRGDEHENREYWALLDWIVARDARFFLAVHGSMYSEMMHALISSKPKVWQDRQVSQKVTMIRL